MKENEMTKKEVTDLMNKIKEDFDFYTQPFEFSIEPFAGTKYALVMRRSQIGTRTLDRLNKLVGSYIITTDYNSKHEMFPNIAIIIHQKVNVEVKNE